MIRNPLPMHPGEVLASVNMVEMDLNQKTFCSCSREKIGTSAEMWVRMQAEYDLWEARQKEVS